MKNTGRKTVKGGNTSAPMVAKSLAKVASATSAKTSTRSGSSASPPATEAQIAARSYEIFLARGATPGHDLDDWFQAVTELAAQGQ